MTAPRLLVFFARIGDLVLLTPLLHHLAADGGLELLCRPWGRDLFIDQPWLGAIHTLASPNAGACRDWLQGAPRRRLGTALARRPLREILVFPGERPVVRDWIAGWCGTTPVRDLATAPGAGPHMVDAYRTICLGGDPATMPPVPRLDLPAHRLAAARARLAPLGRRVVAVQAGSSLTHRWRRRRPNLKGLAPHQWAAWLARLHDGGHLDGAVLLGSAPEGREARAIHAALRPDLRPRVQDWTGRVPLAELPALLAACHAALSVDTGPGHIAAAVGTPLISCFGPTDPAVFAPRGPGPIEVVLGSAPCQFCHATPAWNTCRANRCLTGLPDSRLDTAWAQVMGSGISARNGG